MNQNQIEEYQGYLLDRYQQLHIEYRELIEDYHSGKIKPLEYRTEIERIQCAKKEVNNAIQAFQKIKGGTVK